VLVAMLDVVELDGSVLVASGRLLLAWATRFASLHPARASAPMSHPTMKIDLRPDNEDLPSSS